MLSHDELKNGRHFILKLWDSAGASSQWVQTLKDDTARHWYDIYRRSDWAALRAEGPAVFRDAVTSEQAERVRKSNRCVFIQTTSVRSEEMAARD
jgi:hypothetical protein